MGVKHASHIFNFPYSCRKVTTEKTHYHVETGDGSLGGQNLGRKKTRGVSSGFSKVKPIIL